MKRIIYSSENVAVVAYKDERIAPTWVVPIYPPISTNFQFRADVVTFKTKELKLVSAIQENDEIICRYLPMVSR